MAFSHFITLDFHKPTMKREGTSEKLAENPSARKEEDGRE
jgi:hypothetical protein